MLVKLKGVIWGVDVVLGKHSQNQHSYERGQRATSGELYGLLVRLPSGEMGRNEGYEDTAMC